MERGLKPATTGWQQRVHVVAGFSPRSFSICELLRLAVMLVVHLNVVVPLLRDVVLGEDGSDRTGRLTRTAVDAFFRMDIQHRRCFEFGFIFLRMDAIHR